MNKRPQRGSRRLLLGILLLAVILGGLFVRKYIGREPAPPHVAVPATPVAPVEGIRTVSLFFASPDGAGLVRESRVIDPCADLAQCAEAVIDDLINGPLGDLTPTLPETAMYRGVTVVGDLLTIDFGKELQDGLAVGSNAEMSAVYSVVNTLAFNFPQIKRISFLVEGKPVATLKGHLDLREPLLPDYSLEWKGSKPAGDPVPQRREQ
jgi:hypothetical protein